MNNCNHTIPTIQQITNLFQLQDKDIICAYLCGSHMWNSCNDKSDFDMIIVINNNKNELLNMHKSNLEALIITENKFIEMLSTYYMQVLITCFLPNKFIIKENKKYLKKINFNILTKTLNDTKERDLRIITKHIIKNDYTKAEKITLHQLRYLLLSLQIKQHNKIVDYSCGELFIDYKQQISEYFEQNNDDIIIKITELINEIFKQIITV